MTFPAAFDDCIWDAIQSFLVADATAKLAASDRRNHIGGRAEYLNEFFRDFAYDNYYGNKYMSLYRCRVTPEYDVLLSVIRKRRARGESDRDRYYLGLARSVVQCSICGVRCCSGNRYCRGSTTTEIRYRSAFVGKNARASKCLFLYILDQLL